MAFLHSETDENDLTYFLLYHASVVHTAIEELHSYIDRRAKEVAAATTELRGQKGLNHRQRELIAHALKHPSQVYSVAYHQHANGIVYETARRDVPRDSHRGFLQKTKAGRTWSFGPPRNLQERLRKAR